MRKIDQLFAEYGESHQHPLNKVIHWVCVPLIFISILGLLSCVPAPHVCLLRFFCLSILSLAVVTAVFVFYVRLSVLLSAAMLLFVLVSEWLIYRLNVAVGTSVWMVYSGVFLVSWIFQFYGHRVEGKKPSFLKDVQFLLVGPAWLMHFVFKKLGIRY